MAYSVAVRDNETGETRVVIMDDLDGDEWDEEVAEFLWLEGNFSCDCNRGIWFRRAGGEEEEPPDHDCGETRYSVAWIEFADGRRIEPGEIELVPTITDP